MYRVLKLLHPVFDFRTVFLEHPAYLFIIIKGEEINALFVCLSQCTDQSGYKTRMLNIEK